MMISMHKHLNFLKLTVSLLVTLLVTTCIQYSSYPLPADQPVVFDNSKQVILYSGFNRYKLTNISVQEDQFTCYRSVDFSDKSKPMGVEMHLYLNESYTLVPDSLGRLVVPFDAIAHVELQDMDLAKTALYSMGGLVGCVGLFFIGLLLTSCPFIYAYDGEDYQFAGEIYAGSVFPNLERDDYLLLPRLKASDGEYRIKMSNEIHEIQHTNLLELMVLDHPQNTRALIDKYGQVHTIQETVAPAASRVNGDNDILEKLKAQDDDLFTTAGPLGGETLADSIVVDFAKPADAQQAKLIMTGRNSLWLDHVYGALAYQIGNRYSKWQADHARRSEAELVEGSMLQGIPLSVHVLKGDEWVFVDYFNTAGPLSSKADILELDIQDIPGETLSVLLTCGHLFWEIDELAIDFSSNQPVDVTTVGIQTAVNSKGKDVSSLLTQDDDIYYVQDQIGDVAEISFGVPPTKSGMERSLVLHSKGHYEVLRENDKDPDLVRLMEYQRPGGLMAFSRDHLNALLERYQIPQQ